jgi:hypothetical protein
MQYYAAIVSCSFSDQLVNVSFERDYLVFQQRGINPKEAAVWEGTVAGMESKPDDRRLHVEDIKTGTSSSSGGGKHCSCACGSDCKCKETKGACTCEKK